MNRTVECTERLQAAVDKLKSERAELASIVAALAEVTIRAAASDRPHAANYLDAAAATLSIAARAFRDEKASGPSLEALKKDH